VIARVSEVGAMLNKTQLLRMAHAFRSFQLAKNQAILGWQKIAKKVRRMRLETHNN
jgi:hypothetical protein